MKPRFLPSRSLAFLAIFPTQHFSSTDDDDRHLQLRKSRPKSATPALALLRLLAAERRIFWQIYYNRPVSEFELCLEIDELYYLHPSKCFGFSFSARNEKRFYLDPGSFFVSPGGGGKESGLSFPAKCPVLMASFTSDSRRRRFLHLILFL